MPCLFSGEMLLFLFFLLLLLKLLLLRLLLLLLMMMMKMTKCFLGRGVILELQILSA